MPTPSGNRSLMDAICAGEKPKSFLAAKPDCDWIGDGTSSPIDGSIHTSKESYENHLSSNGYHINDDSVDSRKRQRELATSKQDRELSEAKKEFASYGVTNDWV